MISFALTTCNEGQYIQDLLDQLVPHCEKTGDEIVVLDDNSSDPFTVNLLEGYERADAIKLYNHSLNNDFATHKNYLNSKCSGEYIFQVDADETLHPYLLENLHTIAKINPNIELFFIPRVNVVHGITDDDIKRWNWWVNEYGWNCWPDYQRRFYKNLPHIRWEGTVHEIIVGHKYHAPLPAEEQWALYHIKDIERQRRQNDFYGTI